MACLWEPDVTLAIMQPPGGPPPLLHGRRHRAGRRRVCSRARSFLEKKPADAEKIARVWFAGVNKAESDRAGAARFISTAVPRFRDELGREQTLRVFRLGSLDRPGDNVSFFGLDGRPPAFDRVYNHADSIWINYPQAEIKDRFAPGHVARRPDRSPALGRRRTQGAGPAARNIKRTSPSPAPRCSPSRSRSTSGPPAPSSTPKRCRSSTPSCCRSWRSREECTSGWKATPTRSGVEQPTERMSEKRAQAIVDLPDLPGNRSHPHHRPGQRLVTAPGQQQDRSKAER